ncbi:VOC family protein [Oricola thermophila]|uniref:VOC family protein n=1 Tax=Oricola thermophila TaxID=2742145 RepID=A0A6N1VJ43_9HYPH|nr:VOC family protein [Oricola thermophila]QKV19765.1 VOC family protein [Oricola thermophila]
MPRLDGILETALYVADLEAAERFYGSVMGLDRIARVEGRHVFFACGKGVLLLFNPERTAVPPSDPAMPVPAHGAHGPGHACFRVDPVEIDAWRAHLEAAGVEIEADFRWPNGARSIYFRDPAGNSLEIAEPKLWGLE